MIVRDELIRILADGAPHTGPELAAALEITRSAVWKQVHRLADLGLVVAPRTGRGYRLAQPLELLDRAAILAALPPDVRDCCEMLEVVMCTGSTSTDLLAAPAPREGCWRALLAEYQGHGRGRRGRVWRSPFGSGLCLSLAWVYPSAPRELPALSLAAGIAVRRALAAAGAPTLALKWPNDIVHAGAKLAGVLVDVDGDSRGPLRVVVGVGLNLTVPAGLAQSVAADGGLPPAGLDEALAGRPVQRNTLAAGLLGTLVHVLHEFADTGFTVLADEWRRHDYLCGRPVTITGNGRPQAGIAQGIAADGALLVDGPAGLAAVFSGDVTVRGGE